ncbi:MAG: hypothetical protein U1E05_00345, partial [Patescibacteria group bacterium]|nr:hypothetical protein [Patescibacteria group bacterium]
MFLKSRREAVAEGRSRSASCLRATTYGKSGQVIEQASVPKLLFGNWGFSRSGRLGRASRLGR